MRTSTSADTTPCIPLSYAMDGARRTHDLRIGMGSAHAGRRRGPEPNSIRAPRRAHAEPGRRHRRARRGVRSAARVAPPLHHGHVGMGDPCGRDRPRRDSSGGGATRDHRGDRLGTRTAPAARDVPPDQRAERPSLPLLRRRRARPTSANQRTRAKPSGSSGCPSTACDRSSGTTRCSTASRSRQCCTPSRSGISTDARGVRCEHQRARLDRHWSMASWWSTRGAG